jgi:SAM-dependent methyltransferase
VLGDLRRLPFADGAFAKGYALDVFEHLSRAGLDEVLGEIGRVTQPGGLVFAYSHVRRNSPLAAGLRAVNTLARGLERLGLVDLRQERLRKSDHLNPLSDIPDLERVVGAAGFRIARIRYYTPLVGAFVENVLMRMAERALGWWSARRAPRTDAPAEGARLARSAAKTRLARHGVLYHALQAVTAVMMLDVWIFGRVRTGPFFVLLERTAETAQRTDVHRAVPEEAHP